MDETHDDAPIDDLLAEMPRLIAIRRLADTVKSIPWLSRVGEPLSQSDRDWADRYLSALGLPDCTTAPLTTWEDAGEAAEALDFNSPAWELEEQLRAGLAAEALEHLHEEGLQVLLADLRDRSIEIIEPDVREAAALWDVEDDTLIQLAIGSAMQSLIGAALITAADGEPTHALAFKHRLFVEGRWPVSITGATFNLF